MLGHGPQQLPHAHLTPALYAALPVLEEPPPPPTPTYAAPLNSWTGRDERVCTRCLKGLQVKKKNQMDFSLERFE